MKATLIVSGIIIGVLGLVFATAILRSELGAVMKGLGLLMVAAMMAMGAIRIWLASRPYGNPKTPSQPSR